ncbi:MAG TPA: hypothetical protein VIL11_07140 [Limnochordales bacterium]
MAAVMALTLAAVLANVAWFARYGIGPLQLLRIAGPLWLAFTAGFVGLGLAAWLLGKLLQDRTPRR